MGFGLLVWHGLFVCVCILLVLVYPLHPYGCPLHTGTFHCTCAILYTISFNYLPLVFTHLTFLYSKHHWVCGQDWQLIPWSHQHSYIPQIGNPPKAEFLETDLEFFNQSTERTKSSVRVICNYGHLGSPLCSYSRQQSFIHLLLQNYMIDSVQVTNVIFYYRSMVWCNESWMFIWLPNEC